MLPIALAFLLGNGLVQLAPELASAWIAGAALSALPLLATRINRAAILAFLLGIVWVFLHASWRLTEDLAPELEGRDLSVQGYVASIPQVETYGVRFLLQLKDAPSLPARIEITWYQTNAAVRAGELWAFTVRLKRRHGFANPGGFDYEAQLFREGVGATGYVREDSRNRKLAAPSARYAVLRLRARLIEKIAAALPGHPMQGVVRGLVVGDQQAIDDRQWQVFARTGTSHLVAISGLHIGMVAMLAAWLGGWIARFGRAQRWRLTRPDARALCGLGAALGYSLLAGMSIPTQRTLAMLTVYFATQLLRRRIGVWHSFGLALLLVLLIDPFAPLAIGFWLSFGAVAVILLGVSARLGREHPLSQYLRIQGTVTVGLLPPLLGTFGSVSLIAPLVNLFAIPVFTLLIVPAALIGLALAMVHAQWGGAVLQASAQVLDWAFTALQWSASWSAASWHFAQAPAWALAWLGLGALLLVAPLILPLRCAGALLCLPALLWQTAPVPVGGFSLTLLDVGQGLAVVVQTRSKTLLYDTGPAFRSGRDTGEMVVLPYLHARGIRRLHALVASHGDADHVGGLDSVLEELPVDRLIVGPSVRTSAPAQPCQRGLRWTWDSVEFRVLHPGAAAGDGDNNSSCVLSVKSRNGSALLLGDIESPVERQLLAAHLIEPAEVVVAAHHGSRSSSTAEFVEAVRARFVLFSAGYRNRWGFPKADVLERWRRSGAVAYSTIHSGAVTVTISADGVATPAEYRRQRRRYWHVD